MHPINKKNFGAGKVKVYFYDGSAITSGYIVKQIGTKRYVVSNGTVTKTVSLAPTAVLAKRLDGTSAVGTASEITNLCTMRVTVAAASKYVFKLTSVAAVTDGGTFAWTLGTPAGTVYGIDKHVPVTPLVNTVLPAITGTAQVGQTLTVSNGTWTGTPTTYARQWRAAGVDIAGATGTTYVVQAGDVGKAITCRVTASKTGTANVTVTSAATAAVIA